MCDAVKYTKIFDEIKKLEPEDTLQLILESEDEDEKDFYEMIGNFLLQRKQKKVIERNVYLKSVRQENKKHAIYNRGASL